MNECPFCTIRNITDLTLRLPGTVTVKILSEHLVSGRPTTDRRSRNTARGHCCLSPPSLPPTCSFHSAAPGELQREEGKRRWGRSGGGVGAATGKNFSKAHLLRRLFTRRPTSTVGPSIRPLVVFVPLPPLWLKEGGEVIVPPISRRGERTDGRTADGRHDNARRLQLLRARPSRSAAAAAAAAHESGMISGERRSARRRLSRLSSLQCPTSWRAIGKAALSALPHLASTRDKALPPSLPAPPTPLPLPEIETGPFGGLWFRFTFWNQLVPRSSAGRGSTPRSGADLAASRGIRLISVQPGH